MITRILVLAAFALLAFIAPSAAATKPIVVKSPGGVEAWLIEDHGLPALAVSTALVGNSLSGAVPFAALPTFVDPATLAESGRIDGAGVACCMSMTA